MAFLFRPVSWRVPVEVGQPTKLSQLLNAFTAAALLVSGLLLLSAFFVEQDLVRAFCLGAFQVYCAKLTRKGPVTGGVYNVIRHPQYTALSVCSFGLLVLWPRFIVIFAFTAMLFAYYFLAKIEERECEEKFGQSYLDYKKRTHMFIPFTIPIQKVSVRVAEKGLKRLSAISFLYVLIVMISLGVAGIMRDFSLSSLYGLYTDNEAYVSVGKESRDSLERIVAIADADPEVNSKLKKASGGRSKLLCYILPAQWYVSEIPMNPIPGAGGHHHPRDSGANRYRIVYTRSQIQGEKDVRGIAILKNTIFREPVGEAVINMENGNVIKVLAPPESIKYEKVPLPVF